MNWIKEEFTGENGTALKVTLVIVIIASLIFEFLT